MTADELRTILDRFHKALSGLDEPANRMMCYRELDEVWRDLNRACALMKDAERKEDAANEEQRGTIKMPPGYMLKPLEAGDPSDPPLRPGEVNAVPGLYENLPDGLGTM